jgi:hypothetical protein
MKTANLRRADSRTSGQNPTFWASGSIDPACATCADSRGAGASPSVPVRGGRARHPNQAITNSPFVHTPGGGQHVAGINAKKRRVFEKPTGRSLVTSPYARRPIDRSRSRYPAAMTMLLPCCLRDLARRSSCRLGTVKRARP